MGIKKDKEDVIINETVSTWKELYSLEFKLLENNQYRFLAQSFSEVTKNQLKEKKPKGLDKASTLVIQTQDNEKVKFPVLDADGRDTGKTCTLSELSDLIESAYIYFT